MLFFFYETSPNLTSCTANGKVIFDLTANKIAGDPDGMTIDRNGNLWVACFNSNHVSVVRPCRSGRFQNILFSYYFRNPSLLVRINHELLCLDLENRSHHRHAVDDRPIARLSGHLGRVWRTEIGRAVCNDGRLPVNRSAKGQTSVLGGRVPSDQHGIDRLRRRISKNTRVSGKPTAHDMR